MPKWANQVKVSDTGEGLLIEFREFHVDEDPEDMTTAAQVFVPYESMPQVLATLRSAMNGHME
jgi:hypothetical protein